MTENSRKILLSDLDNYEVKHELASSVSANHNKVLFVCVNIHASVKSEAYYMVLNKKRDAFCYFELLKDAIFIYNII